MAMLHDGYQTLVVITVLGGTQIVYLREKEVQPPDMEIGEIDTTTMRNSAFRTKRPKSLTTIGDMTLQCQYDPAAYVTIYGALGVLSDITVYFPDTSSYAFKGWIDKFTPTSHKEGELPLAEVKIKASNTIDVGELVPVFTPSS